MFYLVNPFLHGISQIFQKEKLTPQIQIQISKYILVKLGEKEEEKTLWGYYSGQDWRQNKSLQKNIIC